MSDKPHLSHSQIDMLSRCEKQWEWRYVKGCKTPPGVAQVIGRGTHAAVEQDLGQKMQWGVLLETAEVKDAARDATVATWDRDPPARAEGEPDRGEAVDTAVALAELHHRELAPKIEPIAVEEGFRIEVPGFPFDLEGYVDVETRTHIRDTKTKAKRPGETAALRSSQLAIYHLRSTLAGHPEKRVAFDYLIKNQRPVALTLEATVTEDDHRIFLRRMELAAASIQSGIFKPTTPDNWCCSPRFCGYWDRCEFGSRKAVSVGLIDPARLTAHVIPRREKDTDPGDADAA